MSTTVRPLPYPERCREWHLMSGADFQALDPSNTVIMVTSSPLEVHGPHLPVIADNLEAEAISIKVMHHLVERHPTIEFIHLPSIYVSCDVLPQRGSIKFRQRTLMRVLEDLGRSLSAQGFKDIWVANFHGGPRHFVSIETAAHRVNQRHGTRMVSAFSLLINALTGGRTDLSKVLGHLSGITAADLEGDTHAGAVETALLLHLLQDHVKPNYDELERRTIATEAERRGVEPPTYNSGRPSLLQLIKGFKFKMKYFEQYTYTGAPAVATPELGGEILEELSRLTADALSDVWTGQLPLSKCHSPLWPARWLFTNETVSWAFERLMKHRNQVW